MDAASEQRQNFIGAPYARRVEEAIPRTVEEGGARERRWGFKLPTLQRPTLAPFLDKTVREERAEERERQRELASEEAAKDAFFETPAGRARLAYKRGHQLFQYELEINQLRPLIIPGLAGYPSRETTDPVDVLNSVISEGWKLVTGKFIYSEMRAEVIGCYLFKRSQKRRLQMNSPWRAS